MTRREFVAAGAMAGPVFAAASGRVGSLRVSDNQRFLTYRDRTPFFYLGDTAWELLHRLDRDETRVYLDDRAAKGFNVIQTVVLAELNGLQEPNRAGERPLIDNDPTRPNPAYFDHIDWVLAEARQRGLYLGLLPTWGNKVVQGSWEKVNEVIFLEPSAYVYGRWIATRYANAENLIWVLGGDRQARDVVPIWRAMARGIREADRAGHLLTFHPQGGGSSSEYLHNEPWLDFNMLQSGHSQRDKRNDLMISSDLARLPLKPVLDGEPRYENHPVDWKPAEKGWFDDFDVRQAAYWAVFAGACGHTYGCHDIWQMKSAAREPIGLARGDWRSSLDLPGAAQMGHLRRLIESLDYFSREPDPLLIEDPGTGGEHIEACRGNGYAIAYTPYGRPVRLRLERLPFRRAKATWFDPRTGKRMASKPVEWQTVASFQPPGTVSRGNDWVLVVEARA